MPCQLHAQRVTKHCAVCSGTLAHAARLAMPACEQRGARLCQRLHRSHRVPVRFCSVQRITERCSTHCRSGGCDSSTAPTAMWALRLPCMFARVLAARRKLLCHAGVAPSNAEAGCQCFETTCSRACTTCSRVLWQDSTSKLDSWQSRPAPLNGSDALCCWWAKVNINGCGAVVPSSVSEVRAQSQKALPYPASGALISSNSRCMPTQMPLATVATGVPAYLQRKESACKIDHDHITPALRMPSALSRRHVQQGSRTQTQRICPPAVRSCRHRAAETRHLSHRHAPSAPSLQYAQAPLYTAPQ